MKQTWQILLAIAAISFAAGFVSGSAASFEAGFAAGKAIGRAQVGADVTALSIDRAAKTDKR